MTPDDLLLIGDRILVKPDERFTESESGLIAFPETAVRDNPNLFGITGTVIKLGTGMRADEFECLVCGYTFCQTSGPRGDCDRCHAAMRGSNVVLIDRGVVAPFSVEVGERVHFGRFAGVQVDLDGVKHLVMHDHELLAAGVGAPLRQVHQPPKWGKTTDGVTPTNLPERV